MDTVLIFQNKTAIQTISFEGDCLGRTTALSLSRDSMAQILYASKVNYEEAEQTILEELSSIQGIHLSSLESLILFVDEGSEEEKQEKYTKLENIMVVGKPRLL